MSDEQNTPPALPKNIRRFSVPIILIWLAVAVLLNIFVPQLEKVAEEVSVPLSPENAPSVYGMKEIGKTFEEYDSDNIAMVTLVGDEQLGDDAHTFYDELVDKLEHDTDHVQHVLNLWGHTITSSGVESRDRKAAYVQVNLAGNQGGAHGNESIKAVRDIVHNADPPEGVKAVVAGQGSLTADTIEAGDKSMVKMTGITIVVITIMLLFVYRSLSTVLLILFIVFVEMGAGRGIVSLFGSHGLLGLSTFAVSLLTALAIAAGTDYAIFLIGRYHEGRTLGMDKEAAYYDTFGGVSKVILGSGLTIVGAVLCLYITQLPYFNSLGIPCSLGLLVVVSAAVTLGPAVLTVATRLGLLEPKRKLNYGRWRRVGTAIVRWPAPILATSLTLAAVGALGLAGFEPLYNERYYLPKHMPSFQAYNDVRKHFTEARMNPDLLMVKADHDLRNPTDMLVLDRVAKRIFELPGIDRVQSITRPLGPPIEHGSVPFQVSVQTAPIRTNLYDLKKRIADIRNIADDLGEMIGILEHTYDLTNQLTDATHDTTGDVQDTAATTDKVRNNLANFEDFFRPIRNYFHWEQHCYTIPICSALRNLWDSFDGVDDLAEDASALAKDTERIDHLIPQLRDQLPPLINISKDMHLKTLTIYATFDSLIEQMDALTDTNSVMAEAFDDSKVDSVFYVPPEIFDNPDFQLGEKLLMSPDGKAARFIITHDVDPATAEGISVVDDIRKSAYEALKLTSLSDADLELGGTAATFKDIRDGAEFDLMIAGAATIMLVFIIMMLITRAIVPAIVIVGTVVLSLGAAFGISFTIWQHILDFKIHWVALVFALIVLLAVGSDYNLMLISRFDEEKDAGLKTGTIRGLGSTGPVVTAAGLVFAFTMGSMLTSDLRSIGQFGSTIGIGLLFDTFVVRSLITPSIVTLLGRWFWWPKQVRTREASTMLREVGPRPLVRALLNEPIARPKAAAASHADSSQEGRESPPPSEQ